MEPPGDQSGVQKSINIAEVEEVACTEEEPVPLKRFEKMDKQMLSLRRENQLLKNTLDLAIRQIEENQRRIERLEAVVNRKED